MAAVAGTAADGTLDAFQSENETSVDRSIVAKTIRGP